MFQQGKKQNADLSTVFSKFATLSRKRSSRSLQLFLVNGKKNMKFYQNYLQKVCYSKEYIDLASFPGLGLVLLSELDKMKNTFRMKLNLPVIFTFLPLRIISKKFDSVRYWRLARQWSDQLITSIRLLFHNCKLSILEFPQAIKRFNIPMKPSHQKRLNDDTMSYYHVVVWSVCLLPFAIKSLHKAARSVIYVRSRFAFRPPIVKFSNTFRLLFKLRHFFWCFFQMPVSKVLISQSWIFHILAGIFILKRASNISKSLLA
mmetsp:Transcript_27728/g.33897  ORF Transcript_27728/g.33897 Transcript_27728/m.33897 type:complete len:260 (+) Transcript_27728:213-992(+)